MALIIQINVDSFLIARVIAIWVIIETKLIKKRPKRPVFGNWPGFCRLTLKMRQNMPNIQYLLNIFKFAESPQIPPVIPPLSPLGRRSMTKAISGVVCCIVRQWLFIKAPSQYINRLLML